MIEKIRSMLEIPELRKKLFVTFLVLFIFRLGVYIPLPGVDPEKAVSVYKDLGPLQGWLSAFTGGALEKNGLFALGIIPYITSSIIFQMLTHVIPALEKMAKEGRAGYQRIQQYARFSTVAVALVHSIFWVQKLMSENAQSREPFLDSSGFWSFQLPAVLSLVGGALFCMWLGEQITEYGIGEGASVLIMANIVADLPKAVREVSANFSVFPEPGQVGPLHVVMLLSVYVLVVAGIVFITQGQRRIPMQSARQVRGMGMSIGPRQYLPLRVNMAGVIPVIFASAVLQLPLGLLYSMGVGWVRAIQEDRFLYMVPYVALIFFFAFFYTSIIFNPAEWADNLKQQGSFIPGYRPGQQTADYLEKIINRVTLAGAAFLSVLAVLPPLVQASFGIPATVVQALQFTGGTGLLIVVGVMLDVTQKVESHLLMRQREGFMRKTRMRGRFA